MLTWDLILIWRSIRNSRLKSTLVYKLHTEEELGGRVQGNWPLRMTGRGRTRLRTRLHLTLLLFPRLWNPGQINRTLEFENTFLWIKKNNNINDHKSYGSYFNSFLGKAKLILGALCRRHEAEPINAGVGHCCDDSYAFRKPCFDDLQVDGTYISPHLSCDQVVNLNEDLCRAQEEELKTEKQK